MQNILIVDDEPDILDFISYNLTRNGYGVFKASTGRDAINIARKNLPDLILLDVMMPGMDGIETCREMRTIEQLQNSIIALLTARNEDYSQIAGFDAGADDYITKPIRPRVLLSRINALLRRKNTPGLAAEPGVFGNLKIDREKYLVFINENKIALPKKEFELLSLLSSYPGKVFTREDILDSVWGDDTVVGNRTIDVHVRRLREKIGNQFFKTVKGVGYKFDF